MGSRFADLSKFFNYVENTNPNIDCWIFFYVMMLITSWFMEFDDENEMWEDYPYVQIMVSRAFDILNKA